MKLRSGKTYSAPALKVVKKKSAKTTKVVPTKALTKAIQQVMRKTTETKFSCINTGVATGFNSGILTTGDIQIATCPVRQGTSANMRIGDEITPTKCVLDLDIGFLHEQPNAFDLTGHVYLLRSKAVKTYAQRANIPILNLLDDGYANIAFDGTLSTSGLPVSKDNFTLLAHKSFPLQRNAGNDWTWNSQHKTSSKHIKLSWKSKKLKYDEALDTNFPQNDLVFWVFGYTYNSPSHGPDVIGTPVAITSTVMMYFKDD